MTGIISGYREKVFAIIGVKVYAAGLYVNLSILNQLNAWKGQSAAEIQESPSLFNSIFNCKDKKKMFMLSCSMREGERDVAKVTFES